MAAEIRYYHLRSARLETALPQLLTKCLDRNWRVVVMVGSEARAEYLCDHLWSFDGPPGRAASFLPHGARADGRAERQPIWITPLDENPNGATVLFLADGVDCATIGDFDLVCRFFDGRDGDALAVARQQWRADADAGRHCSYWRQEPGGWKNIKSTAAPPAP